MRKIRYHLVDVFTDRPFGGNQLAVFTDGRGLSSELMQAIAKELNLSETTFVLPPEHRDNDYRVRIFTPAVELPMAGHPTIGTSFVLAREGMIERAARAATLRLEEGVGTIPVTIEWSDKGPAFIEMSQPLPVFGATFTDARAIAEMLSLEARTITDTGLPIEVVSCGLPFLFVPLKDLEAVRNIRFRIDVWEKALRDFEATHVFVFTTETQVAGSTVHSRMFAPAAGITEDPATGAASGPLGCYLVRHKVFPRERVTRYVSEQGLEMGRPSFIRIRIESNEEGDITGVRVGGQCRFIGEGHLEIEL
ncbi:MAG TPA: PhzF family phenazine biosynthesis protein [Pyrinomonadaceae bacterium]|jgi:trans-2,3-dihydro-3-hydroxyanthranilate isomerase|nr:PhzF family phenazine biosynthesis protein [Pyrinomonadaceae bacterium]